ncbi:MAG: ArgE/DapE family deacylase [Candidatus Bathyarchaeota archaeon]|nr:ArgE/DapE family deacylase [Candidatus Bathyarchaeota archaeon]
MVNSINLNELTELLKDMVKIDSVNPSLVPGAAGESEIADYIEEWMKAQGLRTERYDVKPGRPNVVGLLKGEGGGKTLLINGHTDVVGVDYMTIDPFNPVVKDGKLYGRGSFDMKGGLAASMIAIKTIIDSGDALKGDIILAAVCDEEFASIGTEKLMETTKADAAIVGEFTGGNIQVAHKGFAWLDVETHGVAAHGSLYQFGVDAIAKMGHVLQGLEALQTSLEEVKHPLVGPGSVHASIIKGGSELSTYPAECKLQIERRTIPGETREDVNEEMTQMIQALREGDPKFKGEHKITFYRGAMEISPDEEICQVIKEGSENLLNYTPIYVGGTGWMDTEIIWNKGIPAVAYGPNGFGAHSKEEWVDLQSVHDIARVQEHVMRTFCGVA